MRNKLLQELLDETPKETRIFVEKYADLIVRIHDVMKRQGLSQKDLAEKMNQKPSAISRWLSGQYNITLRSIAKLEAELGESLIEIPKTQSLTPRMETTMSLSPVELVKPAFKNVSKSKPKMISFPMDKGNIYQQELFSNLQNFQTQIA